MGKLQSVLSIVLLTATAFAVVVPGALASGVPLTPDNDNSTDLATPISSGVLAAGEVSRIDNDRYDFYKIAALAGQTIKASVNFSTSSADVRLDVYDPGGGSVLPQQEVSGGGTIRGDTALAPISGTYYIRVNCNANNVASYYNLTVTVADPPVLVADVPVNGTVSSPESRTDWYRVWLNGSTGGTAEGFWVNMTYKSNSGAYVNKYLTDLLNYNGTQIYNSSSWFTTRTNVSGLASYTGWYYYRINFGSFNGGTGTSNYTLTNGRFTMAAESDNDFPNATVASKNAHLNGTLDKAFDHYDWYSHKVLTNDNIIVNVSRTSSAAYFNVTVYNSRLERVISGESTGGYGSSYFLNQTVPAAPVDDTYYIAVILMGTYGYGGPSDDPAQMSYWINFSSPNHPPQIKNQFNPLTINEDEHHRVNIYDYFLDPDGDSLKVKVTAAHIQGSFCQTTGELELFGAPNWYGNENAQVIAQDSQFQTAAIVNVTVVSVEDSPYLLKPIPDVYVDQAKSFGPLDLNLFFFDNDTLYPPGDKLTFGVFANGSVWVNITAAGKVTLTAPINFWGTVNLTFSATDIAGNIATGVCKVIVRHVNQPPQVKNQPPEILVNEDETLLFDFSPVFWDPDGDPINLTASQNMNIDVLSSPGDLNVTFRPKPDLSGFFENIRLGAKDSFGLGDNYVVVKVTVVPVNDPPRITAFSPPGSVTLTEDDVLDFSVAAMDQESSSAVNYAWYLDDQKVLVSATTFVFKTNYSSAGDHVVKISVDDGELATTMSWNVTVKNLNRDPTKVSIISPRPGELFKEGAPIKFEGNATDPDEDQLVYRWMEGLMELGTGRTIDLEMGIGIHKITLEVSDGAVTVKSPVVSITVKPNAKPSIVSFTPVDGKKFEKGKTVQFSAEAIDADNDALSYCWTESGKVIGTGQSFSLTSLSPGKHRILLTVSDGMAVAENSVTIEVAEPTSAGMDLTLLLAVVAVVAVVAGVAAVMLIRRGRKATPAPAPLKPPDLQW